MHVLFNEKTVYIMVTKMEKFFLTMMKVQIVTVTLALRLYCFKNRGKKERERVFGIVM